MFNRKKNQNKYFLFFFLRIFAVGWLWLEPLSGIIVNVGLDVRDSVYAARGGITRKDYDNIDKVMDVWWYAAALLYFLSNPVYEKYHLVLFGLFMFRAIGFICFEFTKNRFFFVIFPNYFEFMFIAIVAVFQVPQLLWTLDSVIVVTLLLSIKLISELFLHYWDFPMSEWVGVHMPWKSD